MNKDFLKKNSHKVNIFSDKMYPTMQKIINILWNMEWCEKK